MRASERESPGWGYFADHRRSHAGDLIREDRLSTERLPVERQFPTWREQVAPLAEVSLPGRAARPYMVDARGYDLGKISVSSVRADGTSFRRGADHIRRNDIDHWVLSYRLDAGATSESGARALRAEPSSLSLFSLAYPFQGEAEGGGTVSLYIERDHLLPIAAQLDRLNHTVLEGITARIAIEFLTSMTRLLPLSTVSEIPIYVETAIIILKGLAEQADSLDQVPTRPMLAVRLEMVKRYIQDNLDSGKLEPDDICAAMKLSRRQLYYLFEQIGGVSNYVRSRRLMAVHEAISDPAEDRPIHTVAASFGFHDAALFSRQFKAQFGYSPKEAREARLLGYAPLATPPQSIAEWLGQVRGA